jgi:hypothetical protein
MPRRKRLSLAFTYDSIERIALSLLIDIQRMAARVEI